MNWWRSVFLLVIILLGCSGTVLTQAEVASAQATGPPAPVLATTSAVLSQGTEKDLWQTTVILSQTARECPGPASNYWLETTSPNDAIRASTVDRMKHGPCRVTVGFKGVPKTLESASLVLDEAGVLSSVQLTLSRHVTWLDWIGWPLFCGAVMLMALLLTIWFRIRIREEDGTWKSFTDRQFWAKTVAASEVQNVGLIPIATIIATFLGASTLANSLFPGVSVNVFGALTAAVEAIAAAAGGIAYGVLYDRWVRRQPPDVLGNKLALPSGSNRRTSVSLPGGADISSAEAMTITRDPGGGPGQTTTVSTSSEISIPGESTIEILEGGSLSFPEGSNILLKDKCSLLVSMKSGTGSLGYDGGTITLPATIRADTDTTIDYRDSADFYPRDAMVISPFGRRRVDEKIESFRLTPDRPTKPAGSMLIVIIPVLTSIFAIGAELGVIGVLSIHLSDATRFGRYLSFSLILAIALFALSYSVSRIRTAADR